MSRVIHTGDTHVGYRQYHSPVRRQDYLDAFRQVVADAVADDVDAVVHAGDLFNDRRPDLPDLLETLDILRELARADIPFLAIVGNHEDARDGQWLDLFETLDLAVHLDAGGTAIGDTTFYGLDYVPQSKRDRLTFEFEPPSTEFAALVGHGLFAPFPHGDWNLADVLDAASVDFDAVLLGDDHTPDTKRVGDAWATYCGSTERTSASERDPRGYNLVTFGDGDVSIARRGLDTRDFVFVDVDLGPTEGPGLIRERIREAEVEDAVVIVKIEGEGEEVTPAEIERFGEERGALVTRVNDRREIDETADIEVSFADPDEAVTERVRGLGLSEAARAVDETVRDPDVADSNVRERVRSRVEDLLDDPDAFEKVATPDVEADPESELDPNPESDPEGDPEPAPASESRAEPDAETGGDRVPQTEAEAEPDVPPEDTRSPPMEANGSGASDAAYPDEADPDHKLDADEVTNADDEPDPDDGSTDGLSPDDESAHDDGSADEAGPDEEPNPDDGADDEAGSDDGSDSDDGADDGVTPDEDEPDRTRSTTMEDFL